MLTHQTPAGLRSAVRLVAILNLAYFGIEFAVAGAIGSVSLFADSIDFLEDASVNFLILVALGVECAPPCSSGNGACRNPVPTVVSHCLDCLAEVPVCPLPQCHFRSQVQVHSQSVVCTHADPLSPSRRQFDTRSVPVGPQ